MTESVRPRRPPFRGLEFFTSADAAVFAGREEEIEEVATRIMAGNTLVVYGPSGVGKTSLLCAGVVPALERRRGYRATYVRPLRSPRDDVWRAVGADPAEPLATALARLPDPPPPGAEPLDIDLAARPAKTAHADAPAADEDTASEPVARAWAPHVLVLDQIEELFTRFDEAQCRSLWKGLVEVIKDQHAPVRVVFALREEYLYRLDSAHPDLSNLLDRRFRLRGLTPFGARSAIVRPLVAGRIRYAPELIDKCVADLTEVPPGHPDEYGVVDPLLLQIVCSEVYRRAEQRDPERPSLTLADYTETGGHSGVFRRHLDELFSRVQPGDHLLLALVLHEMTTTHETKRPTTVSHLSQSGLLATGQEIQDLLDKLVSASLVRRYDAEKEPWYELVHDRLVKALPEQFAHDQRFLRLRFMREVVRQLSRGFSEGVAGATLLSHDQLADLVEPFREYIRFNHEELSLLFRSAVATEHEALEWRDAYEAAVPSGAPVVLLDMLGHKETRRSAALAVGVLRVTEPAVRAECMRLALHDGDPRVEEAAVGALKAVAGDEEVAAMRLALKDERLQPRALRVLGEFERHAAFRAKIETRDLKRAKHLHKRERLLATKETIRLRGGEGLSEGMRTGGFAGLVAGLFWSVVQAWTADDDYVVVSAVGSVLIVIVSVLLGAICGSAAGRAMAKLRALDRSPSWPRAMMEPRALAIFAVVFLVPDALVAATSYDNHLLSARIATLVAAAICMTTVAIAALAVGVTERALAGIPWQRARTRAWVMASTLSLPWLFAIAVGSILVALAREDHNDIIGWVYICGAWCSVCSTAIAGAFAESARHLARPPGPRHALLRRLIGLAPATALLAVLAVLLQRNPLPFWAPVLDVTQPDVNPSRNASTSWAGGRWVRIRNDSQEVRVILVSGGQELLAWPGTFPKWFPTFPDTDTIEVRQPYRPIKLALQVPEPGTYAVVQLKQAEQSDGMKRWKASLDLGRQAGSVFARPLGCRIRLTSGAWRCSDVYDMRSCGLNIDRVYPTEIITPQYPASEQPASSPQSTALELSCPPPRYDAPTSESVEAEIVVLFEEYPKSLGPERGQEPGPKPAPSPPVPAVPAPIP